MTFNPVFGNTFRKTFTNVSASAVVPWYLSGGIAAANCIAAYQPKGAADYAASKVNLANPGTYNYYSGTPPTWDDVNGFKFLRANAQYLRNGISATNTMTVIVRFDGYVPLPGGNWGCPIVSSLDWAEKGRNFSIVPQRHTYLYNRVFTFGATQYIGGASVVSGVMGLNRNFGYYNGSEDIPITANLVNTYELYVGAGYWYGIQQPATVNIQAIAYYDGGTLLTSAEVAAVSTAMAAL